VLVDAFDEGVEERGDGAIVVAIEEKCEMRFPHFLGEFAVGGFELEG
jgi:hypothetical protein